MTRPSQVAEQVELAEIDAQISDPGVTGPALEALHKKRRQKSKKMDDTNGRLAVSCCRRPITVVFTRAKLEVRGLIPWPAVPFH